jgi:hypothetical protein
MTTPGQIGNHSKQANGEGDLRGESAKIKEDVHVYGVTMNSFGYVPVYMTEIVQSLRTMGSQAVDCIVMCGL